MFTRFGHTIVTVGLLGAGCLASSLVSSNAARALTFDFSFTNNVGNVSGTVTGEIVGLVNNTTSSATAVDILTWPAGLIPLSSQPFYTSPIDATTWASQFVNTFTVVNGNLVASDFHADNSTGVSTLDRLFINSGPCSSGPTCSFLSLGSNDSLYVWQGSTTATPIPAALPLFATGLGVMGFIARRRKKNGAVTSA